MTLSKQPLVSIIVRTKNEERWITPCLRAIFSQSYKNLEVVIVDNGSTDKTVRKAQEFSVKLIHIEKFLPGLAINDGIRASSGEYIVCLSGHCVPKDPHWLERLVADLADEKVAGVYGRQEPLSYTSDFDKRDLITVFGLDKKIQVKDSFFHNANSAFRRDVWERFPFDEAVTNIEDRVWGQQVISAGFKLVYEPEASVYHWHGIHQDLNQERARNVVRILESLEGVLPPALHQNPENANTVAVIPIRGESPLVGGKHLLEYTIKAALASKYIRNVVVATDNVATAALAKSLGASAPFLRPPELSEEYIDVMEVVSYALDKLEESAPIPDLVVMLEETYPFRYPEMIDCMIERLIEEGLDTVIAAKREDRGIWVQDGSESRLLAEGFMPRKLKQNAAMIGLLGLGCVTHPMFLRTANIFGGKLGVFEIEDQIAAMELRSAHERQLAQPLLADWEKRQSASKKESK